ncbi:hypothetical protein M2333_002107 [Sphingobium sp. B11D3B]|uniref:hypothetical protein n=1 Tax=Sphingobium sp. B11D3B TaxID=2940575 RepID=UPI002226D648|nr:hypothetical protein [Sphingobium sp. B11D3B]MCW2389061.1 hypothetical protein [Sphingobium sp. B11D3B]
MDGNDAVEFFNAVHERFGTDLTQLCEHWRDHFGPEGLSCWFGLIIIPPAALGGAIAGMAGWSTFGGLAIATVLIATFFWGFRRWGPPDKTIPITVEEVVNAVELGSWYAHLR